MSRILTQDRKIIVSKVIYAESLGARLCGLLGRSHLAPDTGMLIKPCRSIHMFFMRFSIDVAFLNKEMQILKIVQNLRPWQIAIAPQKTYCVLETATNTLSGLQCGDSILIES